MMFLLAPDLSSVEASWPLALAEAELKAMASSAHAGRRFGVDQTYAVLFTVSEREESETPSEAHCEQIHRR